MTMNACHAFVGPSHLWRFAAIATLTAMLLLLSGCGGSLYATVRAADGDPVMLLGHDPVAYFTMGKPTRSGTSAACPRGGAQIGNDGNTGGGAGAILKSVKLT